MKDVKNWENIQESVTASPIPIGPQICIIKKVTNDEDKQYLAVEFDIIDGALKGEFQKRADQFKQWPSAGVFRRSYKDSALPFFKSFIVAVEKSNSGFVWRWDENELVGKVVVINFGEEEWYDAVEDKVKTFVKPREARSLEAYKAKKIENPSKKLVSKEEIESARKKYEEQKAMQAGSGVPALDDGDMPF